MQIDNKSSRDGGSKQSGCGSSARTTIEKVDQFGEHFTMKLDKDKNRVTSLMGVCASLIVLIVVVAYAYIKVDVFI